MVLLALPSVMENEFFVIHRLLVKLALFSLASVMWRIPAHTHPFSSGVERHFEVEVERINRSATARRLTENRGLVFVKLEMPFPTLFARIEQRDFSFGLWIYAVGLRAFEGVAVRTGQPQIFPDGSPTLGAGMNMFDGEPDEYVALSSQTIAATIARIAANFLIEFFWDVTHGKSSGVLINPRRTASAMPCALRKLPT